MHEHFDFEELLTNIRAMKDVGTKWHYVDKAMLKMAEYVKENDPKEYEEIYLGLYEDMYGKHFDEKMGKLAIEGMESENPMKPSGWQYTTQEALALAKQHGVTFTKGYTEWDFVVSLNMVACDYFYEKFEDADYVRLAHQWLEDKDTSAKEEKMWVYWKEVVLGL